MMLLLSWRMLALVAAPLVGVLGPVLPACQHSGSASYFDAGAVVAVCAMQQASRCGDDGDAASSAVLLALTAAGVMYGGSTGGGATAEVGVHCAAAAPCCTPPHPTPHHPTPLAT